MRVVAEDANYRIGTVGNVLLVIWGRETTAKGAEAMRRALLGIGAQHPLGIGLVTVVQEICELPGGDARAAVANALASPGVPVKRSALVHEGSGFRAAAVRGVVTGLTMLVKLPFPHVVFGHVDSAAAWVAEGLPPSGDERVDAAAIALGVRELRARFDQP